MPESSLPAPLLPAHIDLRDFPFMPLDVARLRDSSIVDDVDGEEFRAAILLWCAAWHQVPAGSLPDEPRQLAKFAGYGRVVAEWQKVAGGALHGWVRCSDGRWYHPVVCEKAIEAWEKKSEFTERSNSRTDRARAAAEARWGKKETGEPETPSEGRKEASDATDADASGEHCARMPDALPKGNGQGQGIDRDNAADAAPAPPGDPGKGSDELGPWLRSLVGSEPVLLDPDIAPIEGLLAEGLTRVDVEAGIGEAMARADFRPRSWRQLAGWIRTAAKNRLGAAPKLRVVAQATAPPPVAVTPEMVRRQQFNLAVEHFREHWSDAWPNACRPGHPDCTTPDEIVEEARIQVDLERNPPPEVMARYRASVGRA